jgi:uncharacterized SAM-binding protein YcdF (DUF218 family)
MRWFRIIYFIVSIVILLIIAYAIINSMVSFKYEIEEPPKLDNIDIGFAVGYLKSQITWLYCFGCYVAINVIFLSSSIFLKK